MSFIRKPLILHADLPRNGVGLTLRDYEGGMSTLCAGCGHDSVSSAIVQACWELDIEPHRVVKMSGIGCSSKTPAYFLRGAHGMNSVHGRMPAVATGAMGANRRLYCIGVSGDGDSLSIGFGQFAHAVRRNLDMLYLIENNGVYGLTKGQFSASADVGSKAKRGEVNRLRPIDPVLTAITLGGTFVARSFSGDKAQLVPLIQAGLRHRGFALIDIISPCVTFNDHEGSTKSYAYTRKSSREAVHADFVPAAEEITVDYPAGDARMVTMHDGSHIVLRKTADDYDPTDRLAAMEHVESRHAAGEIATGLLYLEESEDDQDMHGTAGTVEEPLVELPFESLNPGAAALAEYQRRLR
ncbi:MAG: 2-oxoacid:ferredoxin oxidoreductase subunit beta [Ectothiorhodospiraceae bacterium]|nr:2-oxoacid:ferredoxin oxidoreductase subunit beta [Chromatiales bacterium]MCP5157491.1 2-oxoacid:ferredoxin oxidoreductase subunit beta [Ectothiorhodospiraceae bacterium]